MKLSTLLCLGIISTSMSATTFAASTEQKVKAALERQKTSARITCQHPGVKALGSKLVKGQYFQTDFKVEKFKFSIKIELAGRSVDMRLLSKQGNFNQPGDYSYQKKDIKFEFNNLNQSQNYYVKKYNLNNMTCTILPYVDKPIQLNSENVHINMHPHKKYDNEGRLNVGVERYLNDKTYQNIVLIDNDDFRYAIQSNLANFIRSGRFDGNSGRKFSLPTVKVPRNVPIYSHSAGIGLFGVNTDDLNITYTGGNINYCLWNSTIAMVRGFLRGSKGGTLNLTYDIANMVAQKKNRYFGPTFRDNGKYQSIYVKPLFNKNTSLRDDFHRAYIKNISSYELQYKTQFYRTLTYKYTAAGTRHSKTYRGRGKGDYIIHMQYINE